MAKKDGMEQRIRAELEREKHHEIHKALQYQRHSKAHHEAKSKFKFHMNAHMLVWAIGLAVFIIFVAAAMMYTMGLLK